MDDSLRAPLLGSSVALALSVAACGDSGGSDYSDSLAAAFGDSRIESSEGMALLWIRDDQVLFEEVPFEETVLLVGLEMIATTGQSRFVSNGATVNYGYDSETGIMQVSSGDLRFVLTEKGEEIEFEGQRVSLKDGSKRVVFKQGGGVEVEDFD